jgi:hypothetical protein
MEAPVSNEVIVERQTLDLWPAVGKMLGLSRHCTYQAARRGEIPTIKIGGRIFVSKVALDRLLAGERK